MGRSLRWIYPPIGFAMNVALGTIYSWSVFRVPFEHKFGWTAFESSLPFTVFLALFGFTMPIGGKTMGSIGPKKTALIGAVLVGSGWILAYFVEYTTSPLLFMLLFYGVVAGAGVGLAYGVPIAVSGKWIPERKGLAMGLTLVGFGLSPLITAPLATHLIGVVGVSTTCLYLGIAFLVLLAALSLPLKFPAAEWKPPVSTAAKSVITYAELTPNQMVKTPAFIGLWLTYAFGTTGGFAAISLAAKYGVEIVGLTPGLATAATAVFAVFNGLGRPTFGYLCDRLSPRTAAMASYLIIILAAFTAIWAFSLPLYLISFALLWFTFGGWLAIAPSATSTFFGLRNLGSNYGIIFTAYGVGAIVGPLIASYMYGLTQSYALAFTTTAMLAIIGVLVVFLTYRSPK